MKQKKQKIILNFFISFMGLMCFFCFSQKALALPDNIINYQGKLTDKITDVAVADGNFSMIFSIYTAATGGTPVWTARGTVGTPTAKTVAVSKGIFSIVLGEAGDNAIGLDFNTQYYLGVTVGADSEMDPRKPITASGFAINSSRLNGQLASYYAASDSTTYIGTTAVALNRASGALVLTGITSIDGSAATVTSIASHASTELSDTANIARLNAANSFSLINPLTTIAESWIGPSSTTGIYFKGGNVGIGTTSPQSILSLLTPSGTNSNLIIGRSVNTDVGYISFENAGTGAAYLGILRNAGTGFVSSGGLANALYLRNIGGAIQFGDGTPNMTILNGGNVGIGTTSPDYKVEQWTTGTGDGYKGVRVDASSGASGLYTLKARGSIGSETAPLLDDALMSLSAGGYANSAWNYSKALVQMKAAENWGNTAMGTYVTFGTTPKLSTTRAEWMRIDDAGNVGIGTTSPDVKLDVDGDIEGDLISTGSTGYVGYVAGGANGGAYKLVRYSSSRRYKENIDDLTLGLDIIKKLRPVAFDWKETGEHDFGFIAEEAEEINPLLAIRMNGEVEAFKYMPLTAILTKAMQEQQAQIGELRGSTSLDLNDLKRSNLDMGGQVSDLVLKTDTNISTLAELQDSVDKNLKTIQSQLVSQGSTLEGAITDLRLNLQNHETRIKSVEDLTLALQAQIDELKKQTQDFACIANADKSTDEACLVSTRMAQIDLNKTDIDYIKMILGLDGTEKPGSIKLSDQLEAGGVVAGAFSVKVSDEEKKTIGEAKIYAIDSDEDGDGKDDKYGTDGKSVEVETKAVSKDSKIFVTPRDLTGEALSVTKVTDGESFKVEVKTPVEKDLQFDWWIVESQ